VETLPGYPSRTSILILYCEIDFKSLLELGKKYPWSKPWKCPGCSGLRLWGHGYVRRYFDGHINIFWIKRYRCPNCRSVHTLRPETHYRRFQAGWVKIALSLLGKILSAKWSEDISRQRRQYWWRGFSKQVSRHDTFLNGQLWSLFELLLRRIILSTHSLIYFDIRPFIVSPYLSFAVTFPCGFV
jgi:hypothetical protein